MKNMVIKFSKSKYFTFIMTLAFMLCVTSVVYAKTGDKPQTNPDDELKDVWTKVSSLIEGTGGKLAALGIIIVSIWNREKIGIPYMGLGVASGILLPSIPSIVGSFGFTI